MDMIILSDCLTKKIDEGCLKVANSLTKKIKEKHPGTTVISYDRQPEQSDLHLKLNKLFLNYSLLSMIRERKEPVLYIPFASNTMASALRIWILSRVAKKGLRVIFVLRYPMNYITKKLLRMSDAEIVALSKESYEFYCKEISGRAIRLKTGVDIKQFMPVNKMKKEELREKYKVSKNKKVVLHVGHLKSGRNVDKLFYVKEDYHVFFVVSSVTENEKEADLRNRLMERKDTTIIDSYLEHIEEVYQMADVYLFPVQESENCIDIPLSVLEAAACDIPIVTTDYGELKEFVKEKGFLFIDSFDVNKMNSAIDKVTQQIECDNRNAILEYDWDKSIEQLVK